MRANEQPCNQQREDGGDSGQATAEYALVLLGAATIALVLLGWATGGGNRIAGLLDHVMNAVTGHIR